MTTSTLRLVGFLVVVSGFCLVLRYVPFQMDDAFIVYRFVANFLQGHEIAFNAGAPWVEGFTSPLWFLLLAAWAKLGGVELLPLAATVSGFASWALLVALTWRLGAPTTGATTVASLVPMALVALSPDLGFYAASGMEELLFVCALLGAVGAVAGQLSLGWGVLAALLVTWIRPEGAVLPVCAIGVAFGIQGRLGLESRRFRFILIGWCVGFGLLLATRFELFGEWLPNTYYAKQPGLAEGVRYLLDSFSNPATGGLAALGLLGAVVGSGRHRVWGALALFWTVISVLEGGDWMPHARFLLPALAFSALAAGGIEAARTSSGALGRPTTPRLRFLYRSGLALVLAASVLQCLLTAWRVGRTEQRWRAELAALLSWTSASGAHSIGLVDIGRVGFYSRLEIFDFGGLVDPLIARSPGALLEKRFDLDYLFEQRRPDLLLVRLRRPPRSGANGALKVDIGDAGAQVEARVLSDPRLATHYRPSLLLLPGWEPDRYRDRYGCRLVYSRRKPFPPAGLGVVPESTASEGLVTVTIPDPLAPPPSTLMP